METNKKTIAYRKKALLRLQKSIKLHENEILDALHKDLNKASFEAYISEINFVYAELHLTIKKMSKWAKPKRVKTSLIHFLSWSFIYPEPFGTVLIMSPWNYPFQLTIIPLIGAIAAGNNCVVKPSTSSQHTSKIIEKIIGECFEKNHVTFVTGGREVYNTLLEQKYDYIFFTGSPSIGRLVMKSATRNLTPITLELGGKSPCIVEESANIKRTAKRIVWGKFINAGQTCIAPDYLFVQKNYKDQLIKELLLNIQLFYGEKPENCEEYPKIINQEHFDRLCNLLNQGEILTGGTTNPNTLKIAPTLIEPNSSDCELMQDEIFGPLLPILTYDKIEEVYDYINARPKPLALYLFTTNKKIMKHTLENVSFGGGCINDTISHVANIHLPFGGVGKSGMGKYHGKATFDTFTHYKSVLRKSNLIDISLKYPPFKDHFKFLQKLSFFLKK